ncbi:MAG: hypothetical protein AAF763_11265 [Pseudomonadota bacterium]
MSSILNNAQNAIAAGKAALESANQTETTATESGSSNEAITSHLSDDQLDALAQQYLAASGMGEEMASVSSVDGSFHPGSLTAMETETATSTGTEEAGQEAADASSSDASSGSVESAMTTFSDKVQYMNDLVAKARSGNLG